MHYTFIANIIYSMREDFMNYLFDRLNVDELDEDDAPTGNTTVNTTLDMGDFFNSLIEGDVCLE